MRPGWYPDPSGRYPLRWHDGEQWTPQALDGWQRPVVDPLEGTVPPDPPVATAPLPPPSPPSGASPSPSVPAQPQGPVPAAAPGAPGSVPGPSPRPTAAAGGGPAQPRRSSVVVLVLRLIVIAVVLGMQFVGFFQLPWASAPYVPEPMRVYYLEYLDTAHSLGADFGFWEEVYTGGAAIPLALAAVAATTTMVVIHFLTGSDRGWGFVALGVLALTVGHLSALESFPVPTPYGDTELKNANGAFLVGYSYSMLLFALIVGTSKKRPKRTPRA